MKGSLRALEVSLSKHPDALHYFNLQFLDDGPSLMRVSAAGVWFRSNVLGIPFGDQGFCLSREKFERLGEFSESAAYGEDHLLIWKAKEQGIAIQSTRSILKTSARKYRRKGWGSTTLEHGCLTWRQGIPECLKLIRARILSRLKSLDR